MARKPQPLTFKRLAIGAAFTFASEAEPCMALAKGPWVKVGPSTYRELVDGHAHGHTHRVGSPSAAVTLWEARP